RVAVRWGGQQQVASGQCGVARGRGRTPAVRRLGRSTTRSAMVRRLDQRRFAARSAAASGGEDRSNGGDFALLKRRRLDLRLEALFAYRALCRRASRQPYQAVGERIGSRTCLQIKRKAAGRRPQNSGSESGRLAQPVLFRWLPGGGAVVGWE